MIILGLTGSIGMGKTTAAGMFRYLGLPVYDSDAAVHRLLGQGGRAVAAIGKAFPGVVEDGAVNRKALGEKVFGDSAALKKLEAIVHPLVRKVQEDFLKRAAARREKMVVLDVPLLFETDGDEVCDAVIVVSAPRFMQEARVLARGGMTREKLAAVLARQMPDSEKRRRADFVVPSGLGRALTLRRLKEIVTLLQPDKAVSQAPFYKN
ncbi:MAG: dephospho-CoA kinase [Rhodospirillales bacterium]|nr:dephospho-CoA kinase [Rhodospirillales bacterium]